MNKQVFIAVVCLFSQVCSAQMADVLTQMAIQGQLTAQSAGQVGVGFSLLKQTQLINKINMLVSEIKIRNTSFDQVRKSQVTGINLPVKWNVGPVDHDHFYLELEDIDAPTCSKLVSSFPDAVSYFVNNHQGGACDQKNLIKFIF